MTLASERHRTRTVTEAAAATGRDESLSTKPLADTQHIAEIRQLRLHPRRENMQPGRAGVIPWKMLIGSCS